MVRSAARNLAFCYAKAAYGKIQKAVNEVPARVAFFDSLEWIPTGLPDRDVFTLQMVILSGLFPRSGGMD